MDTDVERHPDKRPSSTPIFYGDTNDGGVRVVLGVRGLGVLVLRAGLDWKDSTGRLNFKGISTFTRDEVGFTDLLNGGG